MRRRVIMPSGGKGALTDDEHAASLNNIMTFIGDVLTAEEPIAGLVARISAQDARNICGSRKTCSQ